MHTQLKELIAKAEERISSCRTPNDILDARAAYLGKKSVLNSLFARLRELASEERPAFGQLINEARARIETLLALRDKQIKSDARAQKLDTELDLSMPGWMSSRGAFHPVTIVRRRIEAVFMSMGFEVAQGPEIEDEFHNFDALNTPQDHPSRNLADTF